MRCPNCGAYVPITLKVKRKPDQFEVAGVQYQLVDHEPLPRDHTQGVGVAAPTLVFYERIHENQTVLTKKNDLPG